MWGAIKILAILFGPRLLFSIRSLPSLLAAGKKFLTIRTKRSKWEVALESLILIHVIYWAVSYFYPSHGNNFFAATSIPHDAPAFMIRNQFRVFAEGIQGSNTQIKYDDGFSCPNDPGLEAHLNRLDQLSKDLRLKENHQAYVRFGHDAYFNCEICSRKKPLDFAWYILPRAAIQYCTLLLLVTILSYSFVEKNRWKTTILGFVFAAAPIESLLIFSPELFNLNLVQYLGVSSFSTYWEHFQFYRLLAVSLISLAIVLFDLPPYVSETDLLLRAARQSVAVSAYKLHLGKIIDKITNDGGEGVAGGSSTLSQDDISLLIQPGTLAKLDEMLSE